ncbi:CRISPR-associated endoribonuclease Cas2 [Natronococcus amylolyticus DSM 10524]|uniref:CRISPR-associated endoribonuclease Cas2 n=1 Tax=Natronococcus amylolyticus DSM 10524 TaxID=1227497 RepID=L9X2J7_9EURY|nr:CRISPR-associated endoribonuclease Cas2 [Natronococcus amylolyticus DSM 10524]
MFVVIVYDVRAGRTQEICNYLRRWLDWRQNSVFDGHLTQSEYERVLSWLQTFVNSGEQVLVYTTTRADTLDIEEIGDEREEKRFL